MKKIKLSKAEMNQLLSYITQREKDGWYVGNKKQFIEREKNILIKLHSLMELWGIA